MARYSLVVLRTLLSLCALILVATTPRVCASEGVREVNLSLRGLVHDPLTGLLYGTRTNHLLQIAPETGEVLRTFDIGPNAGRVVRGANHSLWIGLDGQGAIRSFDLQTLAAGETSVIEAGTDIFDIAQSHTDPRLMVVSVNGPKTYLVRQGLPLPETAPLHNVEFIGGSMIGQTASLPNEMGWLNLVSINQTGLQIVYAGKTSGFGELIVVEGEVYHASGEILQVEGTLIHLLGRFDINTPHPPSRTSITYNSTTSEMLFLSDAASVFDPPGNWELARFDRITRRQTGLYSFPEPEGGDAPRHADLVAWSTNRAAFHTTNALYLLDLDRLFVPSDLGLTTTLSRPEIRLGEDLELRITVTNRGPGPASQVTITNLLATNIFVRGFTSSVPAQISQTSPNLIIASFGNLAAMSNASLTIFTRPHQVGNLTNTITLSGSSAGGQFRNDVTSCVLVRPLGTNAVTHFSMSGANAAYNRTTGRLFVLEGPTLWSLKPADSLLTPQHIAGSGPFGPVVPKSIAAARDASIVIGQLYVGGRPPSLGFYRYDAETLQILKAYVTGEMGAIDLEVSPGNPDLLAIGNAGGLLVHPLGSFNSPGPLEFSEDGKRLYLANSGTCALEIYRVAPNSVVFEGNTTNVACSDFAIHDGLLYFDTGVIFNPVTGEQQTPNLVTLEPWLVDPAPEGILNTLIRTNGQWILRRFRTYNLEEVDSLQIDSVAGVPLDLISMNRDEMALRTTEEIILLRLNADPEAVRLTIAQSRPTSITMTFPTIAGRMYQLERSLDLQIWTSVEANIPGGTEQTRTVSTSSSNKAFYRVLRE